jgi:predicted transcriptional regulator
MLHELDDGPEHKRNLADTLDVSKSTIYNWAEELQDAGIITRGRNGYELTNYGRTVYKSLVTAEQRLDAVTDSRRLFECLSADKLPPVELFQRGEIIHSTVDHDAPLVELDSLLRGAEDVRVVAPVFHRRLAETLGHQIPQIDLTVITTSEVLEHARECDLLSDDSMKTIDTYSTEQPLPYGVFLREQPERTVALAVYSEKNRLVGTVHGDADVFLKWGNRTIRNWQKRAERP